MHTLLWSPAMASGHAGMDEAHRLLFESLGRVARLAGSEFTPAWGAVVDLLEADFLRGDPAPARRTLVELPYWIQLHIVSMDLALAEAAASRLRPAHPQAPGPHPTFN